MSLAGPKAGEARGLARVRCRQADVWVRYDGAGSGKSFRWQNLSIERPEPCELPGPKFADLPVYPQTLVIPGPHRGARDPCLKRADSRAGRAKGHSIPQNFVIPDG